MSSKEKSKRIKLVSYHFNYYLFSEFTTVVNINVYITKLLTQMKY